MNQREFKDGIRDGLPICFGYISVSMAFGLTAVKMGIPLWSAVLISLTNLTSAGQFAGVSLMAAQGTYLEIAISMIIINMRYFLMSLSVSQKLDDDFTTGKRLATAFGITDEIFAVSIQRRKKLSFPYMIGLILTPVLGWTGGTFIGAAATSLLPKAVSDAMGIALYGMFIAIIVPPARAQKNVLFAVLLAIAGSYAFRCLPILNQVSGGWAVIIITIAVSAIAAIFFPLPEKEGE